MSEEQAREVPGALKRGEPHPAAHSALMFVRSLPDIGLWMEGFASNALEGDRLCEVCSETLDRVLTGAPVSDRYVLGLAWTLRATVDTQGVLFDRRELATVLAALRLWQRNLEQGNADDEFDPIASDDGACIPLSGEGIEALCKRLSQ